MVEKKRICYLLRKRYPETFGIRRELQRLKVKRATYHLLSPEDVKKCENNPLAIEGVIKPYLRKWNSYLKPSFDEMENIIKNTSIYQKRNDINELCNDIMFCRLAYGFLPSEYVCFELEEKSPEERREYVSDTDMNVFGYSVNNIVNTQTIIDKGDCYREYGSFYKREAIIIEKTSDYSKFCEFVRKHPSFVKKKAFSGMGKGTWLVDTYEHEITYDEMFNDMIKNGKYLLEERVVQHASMAVFNESSVNTIRCMTMKTRNGIEIPWCFMRTGREGSFVDNGGSGGLVIGIDPNTGIINTDGFDEYNNRYSEHPDSHIGFVGTQIPAWEEMINFCRDAAENVKGMSYLSWDMAYTDNGWDVIEINEVGQFIGPQMTTKRGIKKELLQYYEIIDKCI